MIKLALIGQQDFGKAVLEAFIARGDQVAGVFCKPVGIKIINVVHSDAGKR